MGSKAFAETMTANDSRRGGANAGIAPPRLGICPRICISVNGRRWATIDLPLRRCRSISCQDEFPATAFPTDPFGAIFAPRRICVLAPSRRIETVPVGIKKCR